MPSYVFENNNGHKTGVKKENDKNIDKRFDLTTGDCPACDDKYPHKDLGDHLKSGAKNRKDKLGLEDAMEENMPSGSRSKGSKPAQRPSIDSTLASIYGYDDTLYDSSEDENSSGELSKNGKENKNHDKKDKRNRKDKKKPPGKNSAADAKQHHENSSQVCRVCGLDANGMKGKGNKKHVKRGKVLSPGKGLPVDLGDVEGAVGGLVGDVGDTLENLDDAVEDLEDTVGDTVGDAVGEIGDTVGDIEDTVGDPLGDESPEETPEEKSARIKKKLKKTIMKVRVLVLQPIVLVVVVGSQLAEPVRDAMKQLSKGVESVEEALDQVPVDVPNALPEPPAPVPV
ncbi:hypothetical protein BJ878DRAFT_68631 [Calycina marina]|uniref:Uncharacterized protein n=1 Tax=Calycina marina TaxID=1763456 RepID=A0A9P7Z3H8_9HELO|nr:hypothetical protein BJ878DRAFT_68631 [Calycina marina]